MITSHCAQHSIRIFRATTGFSGIPPSLTGPFFLVEVNVPLVYSLPRFVP